MKSFLSLFHRGVLIVLSFETCSVQLFCKYGINPYLQPLNQSTNQRYLQERSFAIIAFEKENSDSAVFYPQVLLSSCLFTVCYEPQTIYPMKLMIMMAKLTSSGHSTGIPAECIFPMTTKSNTEMCKKSCSCGC